MQSFSARGLNLFRTLKKVTQSVRMLKEHLLELKKLALGNANAYEAQSAPLARTPSRCLIRRLAPAGSDRSMLSS